MSKSYRALFAAGALALLAMAQQASATIIYSQDFTNGNTAVKNPDGTNSAALWSTGANPGLDITASGVANGAYSSKVTVTSANASNWYLNTRLNWWGSNTTGHYLTTVTDLSQLSFSVDLAASDITSGTKQVKIRLITADKNNGNQGEVYKIVNVSGSQIDFGTLNTWTSVASATPFNPSGREHMSIYIDVNGSGSPAPTRWANGAGDRALTIDNVVFQSVPEPGAIGVVGGSSLLALWQRRRRK